MATDGLKRVAKVYGLLEQMRSAELGLAAARVAEAEHAGAEARQERAECGAAARAALLLGDRHQWLLAEAEREVGEVVGRRLEAVRLELAGQRQVALVEYQSSHLQSKQVERVIASVAQEKELEQKRKVQATADDRYGSRRAWMQDLSPSQADKRRA